MQDLRLNLILLGSIGSGKSSTGNTILGLQAFTSKQSHLPVTRDVAAEVGAVGGIPITVYDTPGFSGTESDEELRTYEEVLQKCKSSPCVYLLVLQLDKFTQHEQKTVKKIEELLGEECIKDTWILFSGGDKLEEKNTSINEFIQKSEALKKLVQKYEGKCHVFNNNHTEEQSGGQLKSLIMKLFQRKTESLSKKQLQRIPINIQDNPVDSLSSRRIVLLGKSGAGKSAAGNTILGNKVFRSALRMNSVTCECLKKHDILSDRKVSVVDTPGFFDTKQSQEDLNVEIARSVYLSSPGPHAFLIVFKVIDKFTIQEKQIPKMIEMIFGQEVLKYSIILFTYGDQLDEAPIEELIKDNSDLRCLVDQCGGRYHVFNNRDQNNREQVNDLLEKIDTMLEQNGGGHYSNEMFKDALKFRQEEEEQIQREEEERNKQEEKQRQEETERIKKETEEKIRAELERFKAKIESENKEREQQKIKQKQEEIERVRKEIEERIRAEYKAELERLKFKIESENKEREQQKIKQNQEENERVRKETKQKESSSGFMLFFSKYKHHIYMAAIAAGFVFGGAVGGAVVYQGVGAVVGGSVTGAVVGGVESGTVKGAAVGALRGAAVGVAVGGAVAGVAAAPATAAAAAVGKSICVGAGVGGVVGGASSRSVKGAIAGAVVGGTVVGGAAIGAALSGTVGGAAVIGAVSGGSVAGAAISGVDSGTVDGAISGVLGVGGAVLGGVVVGGAAAGATSACVSLSEAVKTFVSGN